MRTQNKCATAHYKPLHPQAPHIHLAALAVENAKMSGYGTASLTLASSLLPTGVTVDFKLVVTNFLGFFATKEFSVKKLAYPAPIVSIQGTNPR